MATLYELKVAPGHRYAELSIRLKNGQKVWVSKDKVKIVNSDDLAEGEDFTIERYKEEGRMIVVGVEAVSTVKQAKKPKWQIEAEREGGPTHAALKLAKAHDVDLTWVVGTGRYERITIGDVRHYLEGAQEEQAVVEV